MYAAGLLVHLITSGVFGAIYVVAASLSGLNATAIGSLRAISLYVALLWLSMLFVALPVAGEGWLGRNRAPSSGSNSSPSTQYFHSFIMVV